MPLLLQSFTRHLLALCTFFPFHPGNFLAVSLPLTCVWGGQMAAFKALQNADLVVSDRLVSAEILELVKGELKVARKLPG